MLIFLKCYYKYLFILIPNEKHGSSSSALPSTKASGMNTTCIIESHLESELNRSLLFLQETCLSVQKSIQGPLGHYAVNVTSAAKFCSQSICNNNGRCIRKTPESSSYLHMPESSTKKYILSKSFRFIISPTSKLKTIKAMKNGFVCHCYYGWHGESCQRHSSDLLRGKSKDPMTNFNLSVFLSMTSSMILWNSVTPYFNVNFSLKY